MENKQKKGMVDVSSKKATRRMAVASGEIKMKKKTLELLIRGASPKGDVLSTAKIAGIMAAKTASTLIPLCHPLEINKVDIQFKIDKRRNAIKILTEVAYLGRTGVEMEALCAVAVTALTIYDMMKWSDKGMIISDVKLLCKSGGKSGSFRRK